MRAGLHPQRVRRTLGAAWCVRESARFTAAELSGHRHVGTYRLRRGDLRVMVRHPLLDMWVLEEVFRFGAYEPPAPVTAVLARLGHPPRILDLGGHVGCFGLFSLLRFPGARLTSYEPDPGNAAVLERTVLANRLGARWSVIRAAAASRDGEAVLQSSFHLSRLASAADPTLHEFQLGIGRTFPFLRGRDLLRSSAVRVPRRDVFGELAEADLVKLDIEGGEWEILADPRMRGIAASALVLEYHPRYAPATDSDRLVEELLGRAGFSVLRTGRGDDAGTAWAWREPPPSS